MAAEPHGLDDVLLDQVRASTRATRVPNVAEHVLELVTANASEGRAWALVKLAADFRVTGERDAALRLLDVAWILGPSPRPERAIFTVAVAIHCDAGRHEIAQTLIDEQVGRSIDPEVAMAAARVYAELFAQTGDVAYAEARDSFLASAEERPASSRPRSAVHSNG
jgi:hypothetical protein